MTAELTARHATDGVDEVPTEQILKPVLVRVMCIGTTVEVVGRGIFTAFFITSVLRRVQYTCNDKLRKTYTIPFLVKHEGGDGPTSVGADSGLSTDMDSGTAPAILILGTRDSVRRRRHW